MSIGKSHLTRGAWIEICDSDELKNLIEKSHLTRGAWIEILCVSADSFVLKVAPHTRCVD